MHSSVATRDDTTGSPRQSALASSVSAVSVAIGEAAVAATSLGLVSTPQRATAVSVHSTGSAHSL